MTQAIDQRLTAARQIAREAGALARHHFENLDALTVEAKGHQDPVSEADRAVERLIVERLQARFPDDTVLGEEYGGRPGPAVWVIDPIDGTANFVRGLPLFCVSIAFVADGVTRVGVIYDPMRDELFSAREGGGAFCNDRPIRVRPVHRLEEATLCLGYNRRRPLAMFMGLIEAILAGGGEYRRLGSAALGLAYTAAGRLDGFLEAHINSWDVLAGLLLVREAGGWHEDFLAGEGLVRGNRVLAATPGLEDVVQELTRRVGFGQG